MHSADIVIATFTYDVLGRRQSKTVDGVANGYVYDGVNIVQELTGIAGSNNDPANVKASYINGRIDEVFAQLSGTGASATILTYLTDALGSTIRLADATGAKVVDYTYDPYGNTTADAAVSNPFQYTGRENDGTGLYYYRARYYSPTLARFISSDPIGLGGGLNTYAYVRDNPLNLTDPLGLRPLTDREKQCLAPYIPKVDLDNADLHEGQVPWYLQKGFDGITRGNDIYFRPGVYDGATAAGIGLLGHELYHVGQYRNGATALDFLLEGINGHDNSSLEKLAMSLEREIRKALDSPNGNANCECKK